MEIDRISFQVDILNLVITARWNQVLYLALLGVAVGSMDDLVWYYLK